MFLVVYKLFFTLLCFVSGFFICIVIASYSQSTMVNFAAFAVDR